jgi:radical SAM superfamily enzyme YgiQ (UPF0313 family)
VVGFATLTTSCPPKAADPRANRDAGQADIVLSTLNARHLHAAFGLRCLMANMGELGDLTRIVEFDINQRPLDIAERILPLRPRILGLGIYIWNVRASLELLGVLRRLDPGLCVVLGGPEVSHEIDGQEIVGLADHVVTGEADLAFAELCRRVLSGERPPKILAAPLPDPARLASPYGLYDDADLAHRVVYVEASRGCPFTCEFCLSSLDVPVRQFPLESFLADMQRLIGRGLRRFKFVDRTFNLHPLVSRRIMQFFLERMEPGLFVHFEMVPDRLPEALRELIVRFPAGSLQFEVGIQTLDPAVEALIGRRQDHGRMEDNLRWLRHHTGVHVHADLIAGLPGESMEGFGRGFDRLLGLGPQEIQVGILKRLRGTPIIRHDAEWGMVYSPAPPYEVLRTRLMTFEDLARMRRFAAFWDMYGNSGNFIRALPMLWREPGASAFVSFLAFSDHLHACGVQTSGIALNRQYELLLAYATGRWPGDVAGWREALAEDYRGPGRRDVPPFLTPEGTQGRRKDSGRGDGPGLPMRQARHVGGAGGHRG